MLLFYNTFIRLYSLAIRLAALANPKAQKWIEGRRNVFEDLEKAISKSDKVIWMHCSSAGEFEQGKPVIEALKKNYPSYKILVSFFSPSGYEVAANFSHADYITYLPLDTQANAERFIKIVHPALVIFVKYEFWYRHLAAAAFHHIPILLISATFRPGQLFFKWYGSFFRQILFLFRHIFVQDENSLQLLKKNDITHCSISGDTRFDRVKAIADNFTRIPTIEAALGGCPSVVAGSTWKDDEELLKALDTKNGRKLVLAPHEIDEKHLREIGELFPGANSFSSMKEEGETKTGSVIIIDNIGMLSRLYHYGTVAYVGGGFTKDGIHNILEAAVWGKPVIFGPNYKKYREALELIEAGGAFSVADSRELKKLAEQLFADEQNLQAVSEKAKNYVLANTGATKKILDFIYEKRLLTN